MSVYNGCREAGQETAAPRVSGTPRSASHPVGLGLSDEVLASSRCDG
jgi:hypothetical protein